MAVGRVVAVHGQGGAVRVVSQSDNPRRFRVGAVLWAGEVPCTVHRVQHRGPQLILTFAGVDATGAAGLAGQQLSVPAADVPTPPAGTYYHYQLIGMDVVTEAGATLGTLTEVLETGANDVYVVRSASAEWLFPATAGVVVGVDVAANRMTVRVMEGLEPRPVAKHTPPAQRRHRAQARRRPRTGT